MGFMLISTLALYGTAKTLWGRPAGWLAAGVWVTTQGVQFLGSFATYDAMALMPSPSPHGGSFGRPAGPSCPASSTWRRP